MSAAEGRPGEPYEHSALGVRFRAPGPEWRWTEERGASHILATWRRDGSRLRVTLLLAEDGRPAAPRLARDGELNGQSKRAGFADAALGRRRVAGADALTLRYRLGEGDRAFWSDSAYFRRRGVLLRVSVVLPASDAAGLDAAVADAAKSLEWIPPRAPKPLPEPLSIADPVSGRTATIVNASGPDAVYRYLEALPGAAAANDGRPILLLAAGRLNAPARTFLVKYRPGRLRVAGAPLAELPGAETADDGWRPGETVVACERRLSLAVPAAALAARLRAPLLVDGPGFRRRLARLAPRRLLVVGDVPAARGRPAERLRDALAVARAAGPVRYVALCNAAPGPGAAASAIAATLAAARDGAVLAVEEPVERRETRLRPTRARPRGMPRSPTGQYAAGVLLVAGRRVAASAPIVAPLAVGGGVSAPWLGRFRLDLDGDGRLESELPLGAPVRLGGRLYQLVARFGDARPELSAGGGRVNEIALSSPHPRVLRSRARSFARALGADHLALVGDADRIPFWYVDRPSYSHVYALQPEIATDAPYARGDSGLAAELAVGRLPFSDLEDAAAAAATAAAYDQLDGPWRRRAALIQPGSPVLEKTSGYPWVMPDAEALLRAVSADLRWSGLECADLFRGEASPAHAAATIARSGWVCFHSHASPREWSFGGRDRLVPRHAGKLGLPPPPGTSVLPELEGAPVVYGGGCQSAGIDLDGAEDSYPLSLLRLGAAAYLGNTRTASTGASALVKTFFDAAAFGGATLGEALQAGRNFHAHLLEMGHVDPGFSRGIHHPTAYDLHWEQHQNMNLFGDPGLRPSVPATRPLEVVLEPSGSRAARLTVRRRAPERVDRILAMPALARGEPVELRVHTGPGLTHGDVPQHTMTPERGLSPLRTPPAVPPGAWVDVALPENAGGLSVRLTHGPLWADRGYCVESGLSGESRLRMFIPLTREAFEDGGGENAGEVSFDLSWRPGIRAARARRPRVLDERPWEEKQSSLPRQVAERAHAILEEAERRVRRAPAEELRSARIVLTFPDSREFARSRFTIDWTPDSARARVSGLPPLWRARRSSLERAAAELGRSLLNVGASWVWLWPSAQFDLDGDGGRRLALRPLGITEGEPVVRVDVSAAGALERAVVSRFGVDSERLYEWTREPLGGLLTKIVQRDGPYEFVTRVDYARRGGLSLPRVLTTDQTGYQPRPWRCFATYERLERRR